MELAIWLLFCFLVGVFASSKGRSGFGWGLLAFIISPLIAVIVLACMKDLSVHENVIKMKMESNNLRDRVASNERITDYRLGRVENDVYRLQETGQSNLYSGRSYELEEKSKLCPACAEIIKKAAIKCKHCGVMIDEFYRKENETDFKFLTMKKEVVCPYCFEYTDGLEEKCIHCKTNIMI